MAGYDEFGFTAKTYEQIRAEVDADIAAAPELGPDVILDPSEPFGQINAIWARKHAELWEAMRVLGGAFDPQKVVGYMHTALASITGTLREQETFSRTNANVTLGAGVTLAAGSKANVLGRPDIVFALESAVTNPGGAPAVVPAVFVAVNPGPVIALTGTLSVITLPVSGWTAVTNTDDADPGRLEETDAELRARRLDELARGTSGNVDGIRTALLALPGMIDVGVSENVSDAVSGGLLPHSVYAIVWDGSPAALTDQEIGDALFLAKGGGMDTNGAISVVTLDKQGASHTVKFDRALETEFWITIQAAYRTDILDSAPAIAAAAIAVRDALLAKSLSKQTRGRDIVAAQYIAAALSVLGIEDVTAYAQDFVPTGGLPIDIRATLVVTPLEVARLDSSRITVLMTPWVDA